MTPDSEDRRTRSGRVNHVRSTPAGLSLGVLLTAALVAIVAVPQAQAGASISAPRKQSASAPKEKKLAPTALSGDEKKLVEAVDKGLPAAFALLERAVNQNSGTMNFEGVREVGKMFEPELQKLGFTTEWSDGSSWNRAGNLIAKRAAARPEPARRRPGVRDIKGASQDTMAVPHVLLIGHLDTVFEKDSPFQRYEKLTDSTASGPGVCDMKGGDVVMLLALQALKSTGALDRMNVSVYLGGDEERAGLPLDLARRDLHQLAETADVAIGFEDGSGDPRTAVVARRGSSSWTLATGGTTYHSSQIFRDDVGAGAIFEAVRILETFRDSLQAQPNLTFSPGTILGGTEVAWDSVASRGTAFGKNNVVADSAIAHGDLRALAIDQRERVKQTMNAIVAAHLPRTRATLTFDEEYPPLSPTDGNRQMLSLYDQASRDLGFGPVEASDPMRAGAADVSFTAFHVGMAMDGVGLKGDGAHSPGETARLNTLQSQAKRAAVLLSRLGAEWGKLRK